MSKLLLVALLLVLPVVSNADALWSYTKEGKKALKNEEYEKAYDIFSDALALDPENSAAQYNKALALTHLGRGDEAQKILQELTFEDPIRQSEVAYTQANILEQVGDAALQKQDGATAKKAYHGALQKNAESFSLNPKNGDARYNLETIAQKIAQLPPEEENKDKQDQDKNDDKNDDNKDKKQDQNKDQNKDKQDPNDQNKSDEKQDQDKKDDPQENQDQQDQDKNEEEDQQNKEDQDQQDEQEQEQKKGDEEKEDDAAPQEQSAEEQRAEQEQQNALQQIMQYADDAKDLNKPPTQKVRPVSNGKEW